MTSQNRPFLAAHSPTLRLNCKYIKSSNSLQIRGSNNSVHRLSDQFFSVAINWLIDWWRHNKVRPSIRISFSKISSTSSSTGLETGESFFIKIIKIINNCFWIDPRVNLLVMTSQHVPFDKTSPYILPSTFTLQVEQPSRKQSPWQRESSANLLIPPWIVKTIGLPVNYYRYHHLRFTVYDILFDFLALEKLNC